MLSEGKGPTSFIKMRVQPVISQSSRLNIDATYHAYQKSSPLVDPVSQIKKMYSRDVQYKDLKKSCIHAIYHKSRHYLTLMTVSGL